MPSYGWSSALITLQAAGPSVTGTSAISVLNGQAKYIIGAQFNPTVGQHLHIYAGGTLSTAGASPGTCTWSVVATNASITVYSGGASPTLATSSGTVPWTLEIDLTFRSVGASTAATVAGAGKFCSAALSTATPIQLLNSPGALTGFDSTIANTWDLQVTLGSASDTLICHTYALYSDN